MYGEESYRGFESRPLRQKFGKVISSVRSLEARGDVARVMFTLQVGDQMPVEVRREGFYRMMVWTARSNLSLAADGGQQ